jgi:hypothetical protein
MSFRQVKENGRFSCILVMRYNNTYEIAALVGLCGNRLQARTQVTPAETLLDQVY